MWVYFTQIVVSGKADATNILIVNISIHSENLQSANPFKAKLQNSGRIHKSTDNKLPEVNKGSKCCKQFVKLATRVEHETRTQMYV